MKMIATPLLRTLAPALFTLALGQCAHATPITQTGDFTADNQTVSYSFTLPTTQTVTIYTTSYGGGMNLDGTTSASGGFVPVLSLFTGAGSIIASDGGSGVCNGGAQADGSTGLCNDAYLSELLGPGSYEVVLSEFPNVAINNLSDGFLFASDPYATGNQCGDSTGQFLDTTVAPCAQRDSHYSYDISTTSPVPEPPTWALVLPGAGLIVVAGRRALA